MEEKFEFINDFLISCEDWMHGEDAPHILEGKEIRNTKIVTTPRPNIKPAPQSHIKNK